jgi:4-amino-4-deoxy-L-arabinose transferase-like glycosyltransferase
MSSVAHPRREALRVPRLAEVSIGAEVLPLVALTVLAFVLRFSQLHQSLLGDEVFTWQDIYGHSLRSVLSTVHTGGENSPPLFFLLAWATAHLGDASVWIRLPSFVLGTLTVPVVYALGREVHGRLAAMIAAGIVAVAPFAVFYGIEARPYGSMMFFVAVSTLALLRAVRTRTRWWWLVYTLSAAAAAYTHYTAIFALGVQAVWSLWVCRRRIGAALLANAAIAILYAPWLPHLRGKALAVIGALYPLGVRRVLTDLLRPIPGHPAAPLRAIPTLTGLAVFAVTVLGGAAMLALRARRGATSAGRLGPSPGQVLLGLLVFATPVGLLLYSLTSTDLWLPRGLSASLPAAAVAIGALAAALPRLAVMLAVVAMAATLLMGTVRSYGTAYARGPFRTIAHYLDRVAAPKTPVLIVSLVGQLAVQAQLQKPHTYESALKQTWRDVAPGGVAYIAIDDLILSSGRVRVPTQAGFTRVAHVHFSGSFATELYEYRRVG